MLADINKHAVAKAFSKAVDSYNDHAGFQRDVGDDLLAMLPDGDLSKVLDLGCGPGYFSSILAMRSSSVVALDLSYAMASRASTEDKNIYALVGDVDAIPLANNSVDYIYSSLVLQWSSNLAKALIELKRVCTKEVVFSTLLNGSLSELANSWQQVDEKKHINQFITINALKAALKQANINNYRIEQKTYRLYFETPKAVMTQLKGIGANYLHQDESNKKMSGSIVSDNKGLGGTASLKMMYQYYERLRTAKGLPVSYHVCFIHFNPE